MYTIVTCLQLEFFSAVLYNFPQKKAFKPLALGRDDEQATDVWSAHFSAEHEFDQFQICLQPGPMLPQVMSLITISSRATKG